MCVARREWRSSRDPPSPCLLFVAPPPWERWYQPDPATGAAPDITPIVERLVAIAERTTRPISPTTRGLLLAALMKLTVQMGACAPSVLSLVQQYGKVRAVPRPSPRARDTHASYRARERREARRDVRFSRAPREHIRRTTTSEEEENHPPSPRHAHQLSRGHFSRATATAPRSRDRARGRRRPACSGGACPSRGLPVARPRPPAARTRVRSAAAAPARHGRGHAARRVVRGGGPRRLVLRWRLGSEAAAREASSLQRDSRGSRLRGARPPPPSRAASRWVVALGTRRRRGRSAHPRSPAS